MSRTSEEERREEKCKNKPKTFLIFFVLCFFFASHERQRKKRAFRFHASEHFLKTSLSLLSSHSQQKNSKTTSGSFWFWGGGFLSLSPLLFFFKGFVWQKGKFSFCSFRPSFWSFSSWFPPPTKERERERERNSTKEKRQKKNKRRGIRCLSLVPRDPRDPRTEKNFNLVFSSPHFFFFFSRSLSSFIHPLSLNACSQVPAL